MKGTNNILVAGVGGQGSIIASHLIAEAAIKMGMHNVRVGETYGASMRGGSVVSHVRLGEAFAPLIPEDSAKMIIALEPMEGLRNAVKYIAPNGQVVMSDMPLYPVDTNVGYADYPDVNAIKESLEKLCSNVIVVPAAKIALELGNIKVLNLVMIGAAVALETLNISYDIMVETIKERMPANLVELNIKALHEGANFVKNQSA